MLKRSTASKAGRPLHEEVAQRIQAEIIRSNLAPGEKLGTELELAARYGVSRSTIRQALTALESAGLIDRLHGRGTFVADKKASRVSRDYNIHIIVPYLTTSFTGRIVMGAQEVLFKSGYSVSVSATHNSIDTEGEYIKRIIEQGSPGVIIHATESDYYNPSIFQLLQHDIPVVMTRHYRFMDVSYIEADNYQGGYDATKYLIELGHRNIGLVSKPPRFLASLQDRIQGFRDAMSDAGLVVKRERMLTDLRDYRYVYMEDRSREHEEQVVSDLKEYLSRSPEMTAVICVNDFIAADVARAARCVGRKVGEDLSIMGFDNIGISAHLDPPITTVNCPTYEIGKEAANSLLHLIEHGARERLHKTLPMELVLRESCAPPRT
ncbi:MAG TPA: GntR family transcriptional regulator [Firmicutes bacterium]|jgi:GntR family transcriptional regulator of arabinose operon|nr:GntR family transcriptional regulator [Bacillota bacterium]HHT42291.1 GntR family transcriptional regulator [Bacillota bacterium]